MTTATPETLSTDHSQAGLDGAHSHGAVVPQGSRAERVTSFDLAAIPVPTGREEEWRFTPLDLLGGVLSDTSTDDSAGAPAAMVSLCGAAPATRASTA